MKKVTVIAAALVAFAYLQMESAWLLERCFPHIANRVVNPFWQNGYKLPGNYQMTVKWWLKLCSVDFKNVIVMIVAAWLFSKFSRRLGSVFICYAFYHLTDNLMLWYNYRTSGWVYLVENTCIIISIAVMFLPERRGAKIKSII